MVEECRPDHASVFDPTDGRLVRAGEGRRVAIPRRPRGFVDIEEHGQLGCRDAFEASRWVRSWHHRFESFVPQEVASQVVSVDVGLVDPGDGHVETSFGHTHCLGV
jgi:hypothetical protein